ncbi:MAG: DUF2335 domain-containing protein [Desulfobaccales bacterium]
MPRVKRPKTKKLRKFIPSLSKRNPPSTQVSQVSQVSISRSAPLPHPSELERYESILPGAADRIFALAENQSNHRQELEKKALSLESRNSLFGLITGGFIGIIGLCIAGLCIYTGHDKAGMTLGGGTLVALVGPFVYGTRERRIEREQKYLAYAQSKKQR